MPMFCCCVLNVITGFGETAGAAISSHLDIDKVIFCISSLSFLTSRYHGSNIGKEVFVCVGCLYRVY